VVSWPPEPTISFLSWVAAAAGSFSADFNPLQPSRLELDDQPASRTTSFEPTMGIGRLLNGPQKKSLGFVWARPIPIPNRQMATRDTSPAAPL
jgi:hypothetical protein